MCDVLLSALVAGVLYVACGVPAEAQNPTCPTRPAGDSSNACASTAFVATGFLPSTVAPVIPVIHPSSGNLVGSGCSTHHEIWWVDQNVCAWGDVFNWVSSDPSALASITVTGATGTGTLTITYTFGAGTCAAGCATTVNTTAGQTVTQVAQNIITALQANANLYNNVSGAQGQLLFLTNTAGVVYYDYNVTTSTQVKYTCTTCGLTLTFQAGENTPNVNYTLPTALDNNPVMSVARNTGIAPAAGSQLFTINSQGTSSTSPNAIAVSYGAIQNRVVNSTTGSIAGRWVIATPDITGSLSQGVYVGAGLYTISMADKGLDTVNASQLWINGTEEISLSGANLFIASSATKNIQLIPGTGTTTVAQNGVDVGLQIQGDTNKIQSLIYVDGGGARWQIYKPASSTDLRFTDGSDRFTLLNGGNVRINTAAATLDWNADLLLGRNAAASLRLGAADAASPVAQTLGVQSVVAGTSNTAGTDFSIAGSQGTGTGAGGSILFKTAPAGGSGSSQNALSTAGRWAPAGQFIVGTNTSPATTAYLDVNRNSSNPPAPAGGLDAIHLTAADGNAASFIGDSFANNSFFSLRRANGTNASKTAVAGGAQMGSYVFQGYDGSAYNTGAAISGVTWAGFSGSDRSAYMAFSVVPQGSTTLTERMRLANSGGLSVGNASVGTDAGEGAILTTNSVTAGTYVSVGTKIRAVGSAPALSACGGGSPAISGSDLAGEVTMGTTATGCVITFNVAYASAPYCTVTWQATPLASQSYSVSTTAITTVQTSTSSNKLNYVCMARSGG